MPRGGKTKGHKGRAKHYVTEGEIRAEEERKKKELEWKRKKGNEEGEEDESSEEEEVKEVEEKGAKRVVKPGDLPPSSSEEEDEEEEEEEPKAKGVEGLIEVSNPNRVVNKTKKASQIDVNAKVELSRKEREEIQRQKAAANYQRLHEAGKTDEAQRDLARLAIIRQQREDAAKKKEMERKAKDEAAAKQKTSKQKI